jgi:3-methylfumaryl-CoA hydratase
LQKGIVMPVDVFTLAQAQRVAIMLGLDPQSLRDGDVVPRGWHFALLVGQTPGAVLRSDGFPGLGVAMPQCDLPRLLLGGRSTAFQGDLIFGAQVQRESAIVSIDHKTGRNGAFAIVRVAHRLRGGDGPPQVTETQTYILTGPSVADLAIKPAPPAVPDGQRTVVTPDDVMLFQYSALGFNTHRIHFDRDHARSEGHPDLVVNGGLATLLATEYLRNDLGRTLKTLSARHTAPLYVNRPMTILVTPPTETAAKVLLLDCDGSVAAELDMIFDDL